MASSDRPDCFACDLLPRNLDPGSSESVTSPDFVANGLFMKRLLLIFTVWACLPALAAAQTVEEIIARINNQIITRSEFVRSKDQLRDEVRQQDPANADKLYTEREKDILRDLVDQQLLLDKGKDLGITGDTELIKQLDQMRKDMKLDSLEELEKRYILHLLKLTGDRKAQVASILGVDRRTIYRLAERLKLTT